MRIAIFHNYYKLPGGEDGVFELQCKTLRELGHQVFPYTVHNKEVFSNNSKFKALKVAWDSPHNRSSYKSVLAFLKRVKADIGHVHNWFPVISPAVYAAHKHLGIPVVQTLHNYRLSCAAGTHRLNGRACDLCEKGSRWNAVNNRCYKGSLLGSLVWKRLVDCGWRNGVFTKGVDHYVCPSEEVAKRHIAIGIPANKVSVVANACVDPLNGLANLSIKAGAGAMFLGRLVPEKGADIAIEGWKLLSVNTPSQNHPLKVVGDGPERDRLQASAAAYGNISFTGQLSHELAQKEISKSSVLVFPSRWKEPFGLGVIEAMAAGRPVIASAIGAPADLVDHNVTGLLVQPDNPVALAEAAESLLRDPERMAKMGRAAREKYIKDFRPISHVHKLLSIYECLIKIRMEKVAS